MEYVTLSDTKYAFVRDLKDNQVLRKSFNQLTEANFGFSLEDWYQQGFWGDYYVPYALVHENQVISNVSINRIEFEIENKRKVGIQIGTVMTDEHYRRKGLNRFILEHVLNEWKDRADFIYLFANDTVLDFYPKFNFRIVKEYQQAKLIDRHSSSPSWKKLNMENQADVALLLQMINESVPLSKLSVRNNASLFMFYCLSIRKENIYFIPTLSAIVVACFEGDTLLLDDVFSSKPVEINAVIQSLSDERVLRVVLGFTTLEEGYDKQVLTGGDTLFVLNGKLDFIEDKQWMFPVLSHA